MTSEALHRGELGARALDDPLQLDHEVSVDRVVARMECFQGPLAARDEDPEQGYLLLLGSDAVALPGYAASGTAHAVAKRGGAVNEQDKVGVSATRSPPPTVERLDDAATA